MDYNTELAAKAMQEAEQATCLWENEPVTRKQRFREYARNAIKLLGDDINVLLLALREASAEH